MGFVDRELLAYQSLGLQVADDEPAPAPQKLMPLRRLTPELAAQIEAERRAQVLALRPRLTAATVAVACQEIGRRWQIKARG